MRPSAALLEDRNLRVEFPTRRGKPVAVERDLISRSDCYVKEATMKLRGIVLAGIGLFVVQMAGAGPYDAPYGTIEIGDRSQTRKHEPAAINSIDGKSTDNPRRPDPVVPGKHAVEVSFSSARVPIGDRLKTIEIDVKPCKRYRVVAHYTTGGKWEPIVQSVEDIGECKKKFLKGSPAK